MAIVNLGQFGNPRESDFSGLGDALVKGVSAGEAIRSNRATEVLKRKQMKLQKEIADATVAANKIITAAKIEAEDIKNQRTNSTNLTANRERINSAEGMNAERIAATTANNREKIASDESLTQVRTQADIDMNNQRIQAEAGRQRKQIMADAQDSKNKMTIALAKQESDDQQVHRNNTMEAVQKFSMYLNDKKPQEQEMFKSTDQYKELQKLVKKYLPEYINDKGEIIPMDNKDIYATQLEKVKATNAQILASGGKLSPGQQQAQNLLDKVDPQMVSIALDNASKDPRWLGANQDEQGKMVSENLGFLMKGRNQLSSDNPMSSSDDASDPLGLYTPAR